MGGITSQALDAFLQRLGESSSCTGTFYLLGGSALCMLGNPRTTADIDYFFEAEAGALEQFQATVAELAAELRLDVEVVPLDEFIPLPPQARQRRRLVGTGAWTSTSSTCTVSHSARSPVDLKPTWTT
jgi:hypothetical protein